MALLTMRKKMRKEIPKINFIVNKLAKQINKSIGNGVFSQLNIPYFSLFYSSANIIRGLKGMNGKDN